MMTNQLTKHELEILFAKASQSLKFLGYKRHFVTSLFLTIMSLSYEQRQRLYSAIETARDDIKSVEDAKNIISGIINILEED